MNLLDRADHLQVNVTIMNEEINVIKNQLKKDMGIENSSFKRGYEDYSSTPNKKAGVSIFIVLFVLYKWRLLGLSELTPMFINTGLTHLGSEASNYSLTL